MSKRTVHPNSLENLIHEGRPPAFDEDKKRRSLTVTKTGWAGSVQVASSVKCSGVSELLEQIGRGELVVMSASVEAEQNRAAFQRRIEAFERIISEPIIDAPLLSDEDISRESL
ncbi:MAG: hypothetical protein WA902_15000 [Thermosynechococcaceae cyanobacterium]